MQVSPLAAAEAAKEQPVLALDAAGAATADAAASAGAAPPTKPKATWRDPREHEDAYSKFLRGYYFPLLVARPRAIIASWFVIFIITAIFGLGIGGASAGFLGSTRSNLDLPKGTPSGDAVLAFQALYPQVSSWAPAVVVLRVSGSGAGGGIKTNAWARNASAALYSFATKRASDVSYVSGYFELMQQPGLELLALQSLSPDNLTAQINIGFKKSTTLNSINLFVDDLIHYAEKLSNSQVSVAATGLFPLFRQMSHATEESFAVIDGTVIPLAMLILGIYVRSYRHVGIALINLILALILSFAVLTPIAVGFDVNPFAPSIMLSLGVAVCFDYTLFLVTRFREERLGLFKSREEAVFETMLTAGHVVLLSGGTLTATFVILLFFSQNFLQSVGLSCGITTAATVIVNLSMTPAMLLAWDCMSFFDPLPARNSCCCYVPREDPAEAALAAKVAADAAVEASGEKARALRARERVARSAKGLDVAVARESVCFRMPWVLSSLVGRCVVMAVVLLLTVPFLVTVLQLTPTSDSYLIYLQGSSTLNALTAMKESFPEGALSPYNVILDTGTPGAVLTPEYFVAEDALVRKILASEQDYVNPSSIACLSFFQSRNVSFATAMQYLNLTSPLFGSSAAAGWRSINMGKLNADQSASLISIETTKSPNSQIIVPFIISMRKLLTAFSSAGVPKLKTYLFGGYTTTMDVQDMLYALLPIDIICVVLLVLVTVAFSFRSVGLAVRLIATLALSLCWTFGLTVLVYQPGPAQNAFANITPTILASSGVYWIIPIMSFSILVGLALDYDIFLSSRTQEFRELGWSDRAAVCLAVEKTGSVITAAGLIMSVSFLGLLIPKTVVLNQYGFTLFIGVVLDTFLMRPIVVPAIVTIMAEFKPLQLNWYPANKPAQLLTDEEEEHALAAGLWDPRELAALRAALAETDEAAALVVADGAAANLVADKGGDAGAKAVVEA